MQKKKILFVYILFKIYKIFLTKQKINKNLMQIVFHFEFQFEVSTVPNEEVKLVGSLKEMGKWNPLEALSLSTYQGLYPI